MSIKKVSSRPKKHAKDGNGTVETYFFDVEKCKHCPQRNGCYKDGARTKSYSVSIKSNTHKEQMEFQESEYFKRMSKERYMIEAKNSELKHRHGYDIASSSGLIGMQIQAAVTIYVVNLKRIFPSGMYQKLSICLKCFMKVNLMVTYQNGMYQK